MKSITLSKYLMSIFLTLLLSFGTLSSVYAITTAEVCEADIISPSDPFADAPDPLQIVCPFIRIFNVLLLSVGVVFVIMILWGGIKMSMALGDPKGFEGAKMTWTYAVVGLVCILGFFTLFMIIDGILGLGFFTTPNAIFDKFVSALDCLLVQFGIVSRFSTC